MASRGLFGPLKNTFKYQDHLPAEYITQRHLGSCEDKEKNIFISSET